MPKMKTHSSSKKRLSVTGTGKMALRQSAYVDSANAKAVKKLLPYQ